MEGTIYDVFLYGAQSAREGFAILRTAHGVRFLFLKQNLSFWKPIANQSFFLIISRPSVIFENFGGRLYHPRLLSSIKVAKISITSST